MNKFELKHFFPHTNSSACSKQTKIQTSLLCVISKNLRHTQRPRFSMRNSLTLAPGPIGKQLTNKSGFVIAPLFIIITVVVVVSVVLR